MSKLIERVDDRLVEWKQFVPVRVVAVLGVLLFAIEARDGAINVEHHQH
ncbi:hypothetical protein [Microbacterium lacticum]